MTTKRKGELYTKSFSDSDDIRGKFNAFMSTKSIKLRHPRNVFFVHLNLNSICNKLASIQELIKSIEKAHQRKHISETNIDDSFPNAQFKIEVYRSFRKEPGTFGGRLLFYVDEKLNCKSLESCLPNNFIDIVPLEISLLYSKCVILGTYKPPSLNEPTFISEMLLKYYRSLHDNVLLLHDFKMSFSKKNIKDLCDLFELNHIIKDTTRFKRQTPHALIISILTKRHRFLIHLLSRLTFLVTVV